MVMEMLFRYCDFSYSSALSPELELTEMPKTDNVIAFDATAEKLDFKAVRRQLTVLLLERTLIQSFANFQLADKPYPFIRPEALAPGSGTRSIERSHQNTALLFAVDGALPVSLNKHFRLRSSNRVTWRNIQRLAPEIDLSNYKASDRRFDSANVNHLLSKMLPLDYALLIERTRSGEQGSEVFQVSHLHVKVERLTDNAIKDLGRRLGYIDRRLFERGEDFVEALEAKFFEYYGFTANASGRKSAAAMATQLLATGEQDFAVFVAGQEDNRLTVLDGSDYISQYLLVRLVEIDAAEVAENPTFMANRPAYGVSRKSVSNPVVVLRARFRRTKRAKTTARTRQDKDILAPWLEIWDQNIVAKPGQNAPDIPVSWYKAGMESV